MPKARRYSHKSRHRRYNRSKRGGENTDTLDRMEQGRKYGDFSAPTMYDKNTINILEDKPVKVTESAVDFFDKASKGMEEQAVLEDKYANYIKKKAAKDEMLQKWRASLNNPMTAEELFSGDRPEIKYAVEEYDVPMDPFTYGQEKGGRKSRRNRRYRRKGRKSRKHRKH
jgi:hypothetical protein